MDLRSLARYDHDETGATEVVRGAEQSCRVGFRVSDTRVSELVRQDDTDVRLLAALPLTAGRMSLRVQPSLSA